MMEPVLKHEALIVKYILSSEWRVDHSDLCEDFDSPLIILWRHKAQQTNAGFH